MLGTIFLLYCSRLCGQPVQQLVHFKKYDQSNGLTSANIRKIGTDKYGFVWIATQDGLNKFDGNSFFVFNSNVTSQATKTLGSDFHDFVFINNELWTVTAEGGINVIDIEKNRVKASYEINAYIKAGEYINSMFEYRHSLVLVTQHGNILRFDLVQHAINKIAAPGYPDGSALNIIKGLLLKDQLWLFTDVEGIFVQDIKSNSLTRHIQSPSAITASFEQERIYDVLPAVDSTYILVATDNNIVQVHTGNFTFNTWLNNEDIFGKKDNSYARCMAWYGNKLLLASSEQLVLYDPIFKKTAIINPVNYAENKQWFKDLQLIYSNKTTVFLGNQTGISLLNSLDNPFVSYSRSSGNYNVTIGHNTHLCSIGDSIVYSCTTDKTLYKTNIISGDIKLIDSSQVYFQAIKINEKDILFSGDKHMMLLRDNKLSNAVNTYPGLKQLNGDFVIASLVLNDSIILMASQNGKGIYAFNKKTDAIAIINDNVESGLYIKDLAINNFYLNDKNELLVLSSGSITVLNFKNRSTAIYKLRKNNTGSFLKIIMDVTQLHGSYYFAVYGVGIVVTDEQFTIKKILSANEGILNAGVYKIFGLSDSTIICSSNNGLYIYDVFKNTSRKLSSEEGLQSNNFEETSGEKTNSKIIFGGENGFTVIYPEKIYRNNVAPILYFTKLSLQLQNKQQTDSINLLSTFYKIGNDVIQTNIEFSGINYSSPENTIYAYRITEQSKEWINLSNQNFVTLIGLSPGVYHLQVKAANEDGIWSEPQELILQFLPKWYQTWWFKLLILVTTAGIIYAFYRYRIRQVKKQHEIRKNIATDLHDDLGSTLNSVKVFTNLAISGIKQEESLQQVKDNLTEATMSLRDMIWVLDDSLDTVDEMVTRLKQFTLPVAAASNIDAVIKAESEVNTRQLTKEEKRNLFLVCKEAINNSIKYSAASIITVDIQPAGKKIKLSIADNGKGFDESTVKKGYGLKNMQYRAAQIRYKVVLNSILGKGTQIDIIPV